MKKQAKRFTSLLCVLALCMSLLPMSALAAELPAEQPEEETQEVAETPAATTEPSEEPDPTETTVPTEPEETETPDGNSSATTQAEGDVAQIGDTTYATLNAAISAANDGETIELLSDASLSTIAFPAEKTITVDGNGFTIDANQAYLNIAGAVTFQDCTMNMHGTPNGHWMYIYMASNGVLTFNEATLTIDGTDAAANTTAMYFPEPGTPRADVNFTDSTVTIKNCDGNGITTGGSTNNGNNRLNITRSSVTIDNCAEQNSSGGGGIVGTFDITVDESSLKVINNTSYGSNGPYYTIRNNSNVTFDNNGTWGISAYRIDMTGNSTLTATNNGYSGVWVRILNIDDTCTLDVERNGYKGQCDLNSSAVGATSNAGISFWGNGSATSTIEKGANVTIKDNAGSGISTLQGVCNLSIGSASICNNGIDGAVCGGGVYNVGTLSLGEDVVIYNNHASVAGDDIYNSLKNDAEITFGQVGDDWALDGDPDCTDAIDGWYDDSEGARWEAHTAPLHVKEFTSFDADTGLATVTGLTALKAAHNVIPVPSSDDEVILDKTATGLNNDKTNVTLTVGAKQDQTVSDVVFVLDKSVSTDVRESAVAMLDELMTRVGENRIKVGVVIFNKSVYEELPLTDLNEENYEEIETALMKETKSGTNIYAGLMAGKAVLDADTSVSPQAKHLVLVTDGVTYLWGTGREKDGSDIFTIYSEQSGTNEESINAGNDMMKAHHPEIESYWAEFLDMAQWMKDHGTSYAKDIETYQHVYGVGQYEPDVKGQGTDSTYAGFDDGEYIPGEELTSHACANDAAVYMAATAWQKIVNAGYHAYAYAELDYDNPEDELNYYPWGSDWVESLKTIGGTSSAVPKNTEGMFDEVKSSILYAVQSGTINDVIGDDFDLTDKNGITDGTFTLTIGGEKQAATLDEAAANTVNFGIPNTEGVYPYVLTYYPNGVVGDTREQFDLEINVPVENAKALQLTYSLTLVEKSSTAGTYRVPTNEEATLTYIPTVGTPAIQEFPVPEVSYTIESKNPGTSGGNTPSRPTRPDEPEDLNTEDHVAYIIGYTDGTVRPEGSIARSEVATIFFRLLTDEARNRYWSQSNPYSDVDIDDWYNNAISTLTNMGILDGYPDGTFRPTEPITRSEFTKIAVSFFDYADQNFRYDGRFSDVEGNEWYVSFLAAAVEYGLIEGMPDGTFHPLDDITRAEACTIVNRTLGREPDEDYLLPRQDMITWPDNSTSAWYYADMQEATNSHDYVWVEDEEVEDWTEKLEERDWAALERAWSNANSAPGGEVMD